MKHFLHLIGLLCALSTSISAQNTDDSENTNTSQSDHDQENKTPVENTAESETNIFAAPTIYDQRNLLSPEQITKIKAAQQDFYTKHKCIISYGFYNGHIPSMSLHQSWKDMVSKDEEREFHLLISIGVLTKRNIIEIHYRYPPALKNAQEINTVLANLKRDLQSEIGLDSLLDRSFKSVIDELSYLSNKPKYESDVQKEVNAFEAKQLKKYLLKILKIIALIVIPIIAFMLIWSIFSRIRNSLTYRFPDVEYVPRFGAKSSATSITKTRK